MLRAFFINPLLIATLCVLSYCLAKATGLPFHLREMVIAGGVSAVASELALVPLLITRGKSQGVVSQAGLVGTVVHTMFCAGVGMGVSVLLRTGQPLMYWLLLFYWATLVSIAVAAVRMVKVAPMETNSFLTR